MYILINVLMLIVIFSYFNFVKIKNSDIDKNLFDGRFFNLIHLLSYTIPLKYLLKENNELSKKEKDIDEKILKLNLTDKFNLRSFIALRFLLLFISIGLFVGVLAALKINKGAGFSILANFHYVIVFLLIPLSPNVYLKMKEIKYRNFYYDEVVILQLFMILLIKSNSTIEGILFSFSKMNTFHKKAFEKAYRISLRSKKDALLYLENKFEDLVFGNSFNILRNMHEYSKEDSVRILKANLRRMEEESMNRRRKEELNKFSFSQVSILIPFSIVIFLGAIPIIHYGVSIMVNSMQGL